MEAVSGRFRILFSERVLAIPFHRGARLKEEVHRTSPPFGRLPASSAGRLRGLTRQVILRRGICFRSLSGSRRKYAGPGGRPFSYRS